MLALYDFRRESRAGAGLVRERAARTAVGHPSVARPPRPWRPKSSSNADPDDQVVPGRRADTGSQANPAADPGNQATAVPTADLIDLELLRGLRVVRYVEAGLLRVEARCLAWMRDRHAHRELGFSSFGDMTRMLQIAPRTAQEHVLLHRLLEGRPAAEEAFRMGDLSLHHVLALAPVLRRGDLYGGDRHGGELQGDDLLRDGRPVLDALRWLSFADSSTRTSIPEKPLIPARLP